MTYGHGVDQAALLDEHTFQMVRRLPETLWPQGGVDQRSHELTPLYIERFHGPLAGRQLTTHPYWEMIIVCEGEGEMRTEIPFSLRPGVLCLIPPGIKHIERSRQVMEVIWMGLRGTRVDRLPRTLPLVAESAEAIRVATTCWRVARKAYGNIGIELEGLALVLLSRLCQAISQRDDSAVPRLDEAVTYLHAHFHEEIDVPALARQCGYSEGYFYRAFKQLTGKTPIHYLTALRVQEALRWLEHSDHPIHQIATSVGFSDPHYFSRIFKRMTGLSPLAVRRNAQRAAE